MANILLVEDMKGVRDSLDLILSSSGHNIELAENGKLGIEKIKDNTYDLIITDILMPEIDGAEVIIYAKQKDSKQKVLAISAGGNGISADQALELASQKADDILEKPFSKDDLIEKINALIA